MQVHCDAIFEELQLGSDMHHTSLEAFGFTPANIEAIKAIPADWKLCDPRSYECWDLPDWATTEGFHTEGNEAAFCFYCEMFGDDVLQCFRFSK